MQRRIARTAGSIESIKAALDMKSPEWRETFAELARIFQESTPEKRRYILDLARATATKGKA